MKIVIWGHKLHTHTHSYVHCGFYTAFKHLGYETYWFDDSDDIRNIDLSNSLFITEGQVDKQIPQRKDCLYVLHNCDTTRYSSCNIIGLQTYTLNRANTSKQKIYFDGSTLTMCWATDLLPHEIDIDAHYNNNNSKIINWIGTIGGSLYGNENELRPFIQKAQAHGIAFKHSDPWSTPKSFEENRKLIQQSYLAPSIVGNWQKENGYIPCRIFKNISYGKMGITNSLEVKELFGDYVVYNENTSILYDQAEIQDKQITKNEMRSAMLFVKDNHTYINRAKSILECFNL